MYGLFYKNGFEVSPTLLFVTPCSKIANVSLRCASGIASGMVMLSISKKSERLIWCRRNYQDGGFPSYLFKRPYWIS